MKKLIFLFILLYLLVLITGCSTPVTIPDFKVYVTLPASQDGYWVNTVSPDQGRVPKKEWDEIKNKGLIIMSEDWLKLRNALLKNCLQNTCKDTVGVFDTLFNAIKK